MAMMTVLWITIAVVYVYSAFVAAFLVFEAVKPEDKWPLSVLTFLFFGVAGPGITLGIAAKRTIAVVRRRRLLPKAVVRERVSGMTRIPSNDLPDERPPIPPRRSSHNWDDMAILSQKGKQ